MHILIYIYCALYHNVCVKGNICNFLVYFKNGVDFPLDFLVPISQTYNEKKKGLVVQSVMMY